MKQFFKESPRQSKNRPFKYCPQCGSSLTTNHRKTESKISCDDCDFIKYNNPLPCVSVIIKDDDGRVLTGRRMTGKKLSETQGGEDEWSFDERAKLKRETSYFVD